MAVGTPWRNTKAAVSMRAASQARAISSAGPLPGQYEALIAGAGIQDDERPGDRHERGDGGRGHQCRVDAGQVNHHPRRGFHIGTINDSFVSILSAGNTCPTRSATAQRAQRKATPPPPARDHQTVIYAQVVRL
jgi:hypothetical protein